MPPVRGSRAILSAAGGAAQGSTLAAMSNPQELQPPTPLIASASVAEASGERVLHADLTGDLTVVNAPELLAGLRQLIAEGDAGRVVLGFSDVGYVDSGALGALIEVRKTIGKKGGNVSLDRMPKELAGLIRIMKLDAVFELGSVDEGPAPAPAPGGAA